MNIEDIAWLGYGIFYWIVCAGIWEKIKEQERQPAKMDAEFDARHPPRKTAAEMRKEDYDKYINSYKRQP